MLQYTQSAWQKYEVYLETKNSETEQNKKSKQTEIIDQETKDMEGLRQQADKKIKLLEQEFVTCVDSGRKENDLPLVSTWMAMKGKSAEKRRELRHLEEAWKENFTLIIFFFILS